MDYLASFCVSMPTPGTGRLTSVTEGAVCLRVLGAGR